MPLAPILSSPLVRISSVEKRCILLPRSLLKWCEFHHERASRALDHPLALPTSEPLATPASNPSGNHSSLVRPTCVRVISSYVWGDYMLGGTPQSVLARPQSFVCFRGDLQPLRYVGNSDQLLQFYEEAVPGGRILPRTRPSLELPGLVGLLLPRSLLLYHCLMYSHGLRSTWPSRANGGNASALLGDFPFRDDIGYRSTPDLAKGFGATLDE